MSIAWLVLAQSHIMRNNHGADRRHAKMNVNQHLALINWKGKTVLDEEKEAAKALIRKRIFKLEKNADKRKKRHDISLRFFITVMIIFVCAVILAIYIVATNSNSKKKYKDDLLETLKFQSRIIANEMGGGLYNPDMGAKIDMAASVINGRILLVNNEYRIIKDTYAENEGEFIINDAVIDVMNGAKSSYSDEGEYIQYMHSVSDDTGVKNIIILIASADNINELSSSMTSSGIIMYIIMMLMCVGFACAIGAASVRGLKFINRQMEFTGAGNFENRIPEKGFREFRIMTQRYNETINKLMLIDSTRQEFVSNVSHELKTPITSMKVLADSLIENEQADLEMYREFMSDIADEIDRETKIINDLLTLVKMDKRTAKLNIEELDIKQLLEVIIKRVTPIAQNRGIEITFECYSDVLAEVDEVKLSLAFSNIIENAVKYNIDNGWVKVTLNTDHKFFYVKVADSGVGIPDDCKDQVFERFYRVDKARSRDTGGTGLGLAITRDAVLMHKGNIRLYSESGQGTTFTIKIPLTFADV